MKHTRIAILIAIGGIFGVTGCTVGPDYVKPGISLPDHYMEPSVSVAPETAPIASAWWKLFSDPVLNELVDKALQNNADVQLAAARIEEAEGVVREADAAIFPEIDLQGSGSRSRASQLTSTPLLPNTPAVRQDFRGALSSTFELDFWGKLRRASESARAQALATRYGKATVELTLTGLVAQSYLSLRALDAQIAVSRETLASRETSLRITRDQFNAGTASQLDVHQAESARAAISAQISSLRQQRALAAHQLALLTATLDLQVPETEVRQLPVPPLPPAGLPSSLLEARPDVQAAEEQLIAANARIGVAKAALFPSISLTADYGGESQELSSLTKSGARIWTAGLDLNLPVFTAGKLSARVDQANAQQKQALASYQKTIQTAFTEVNDALVNVRETKESEQAFKAQVEAAQQALDLAETRYRSGYSPYLEVLDAQRTLNDATLSLIRTRQAMLAASVDLFKSLGGGWTAQ